MDKKYSVAILGCGSRGHVYADLLLAQGDKFEVTALCDINPEQIDKMHKLLGLEDAKVFLNDNDFLKEKHADLLVIATPDRFHVPHAVPALELGYDIILEKPISDSREEIELLVETQKKTGKKVIICHELRYAPAFAKCAELLKKGTVGQLSVIDASERVSYWHWSQAYVRGPGAYLELGHPALLAKCSHDLDLLHWYAQSECDTVSSVGDLHFFKEENAPEGATERCLDCKHMDTCVYSAKRIYIDRWHHDGKPEFVWPFNKVTLEVPLTEEGIMKGLREGEFGRCAFKCNTEKVDRQLVQLSFKNGVKASLKMVYASVAGRRISFYGTHGEIIMDERSDKIEVLRYGEEPEYINISEINEGGYAHGGGDTMFMASIYGILSGTEEAITSLSESVECHLMGVAADESRVLDGALVKVHKL